AVAVFLGVEVDFLGALLVLEPQLVKVVGAAAQAAAAFEAALRLVGGGGVGRHLIGVVNAAHDDRLIRVAFLECDDDLLADTGNVDDPPLFTSPERADADPARTIGIFFSLAVPEKLHFHSPVLVGEDFLARWTHNNRRL